ncbi:MAG: hypothetical protein GX633_08485 [Clostridiales bacterium]|nr:hypothetical protein [Clostridiales bacterium]
MEKSYFFFIDDNIWVFRDLAKERPKSLFDNSYLGFLKRMHDTYGTKTQLNIFCATSPEYGGEDFTLARMPDIYKDEWRENASWLRLGFHARREFPNWPYINANAESFERDYDDIIEEITRFAGEEVIAKELVIHWLPLTKAGCEVLLKKGIRAISATYGDDAPAGSEKDLSENDYERLMENRFEETSKPYIQTNHYTGERFLSLRAYNHIPKSLDDIYRNTRKFLVNEDCPLPLKQAAHIVLNITPLEGIIPQLSPMKDTEYVGLCMHEQYYYPHYFAYEPDYCDRVETAIKYLSGEGFKSIFLGEML